MKRFFLSVIVLALSSAASIHAKVVTGANIVNYQAKSIDSNPKMFIVPIVASVEVIKGAPVFYTSKGVINLPSNINAKGRPIMNENNYMNYLSSVIKRRIEELKSQVLFEFSEKTGADVILSPMYSVTTDESAGLSVNVTIKVKGYPARYTKMRELTEKDNALIRTAEIINEQVNQQILDSQSVTNTDKTTVIE